MLGTQLVVKLASKALDGWNGGNSAMLCYMLYTPLNKWCGGRPKWCGGLGVEWVISLCGVEVLCV